MILSVHTRANCDGQNIENFRRVYKIVKAAISFVMSVRLSVRMQHNSSHWKDFHEILCLSIFRKSVEKNKVSLKSDKNNRYFT